MRYTLNYYREKFYKRVALLYDNIDDFSKRDKKNKKNNIYYYYIKSQFDKSLDSILEELGYINRNKIIEDLIRDIYINKIYEGSPIEKNSKINSLRYYYNTYLNYDIPLNEYLVEKGYIKSSFQRRIEAINSRIKTIYIDEEYKGDKKKLNNEKGKLKKNFGRLNLDTTLKEYKDKYIKNYKKENKDEQSKGIIR